MAIIPLVHQAAITTGATATTSAVDTTGANLIFLWAFHYAGVGGALSVSDSKGNTWTALTPSTTVSGFIIKGYWCLAPTVGSGHTFSASSGGTSYAGVCARAYSGVAISSPFDDESGAVTASASSLQPGSKTPANDGSLVILGGVINTATISSVNSSLSIIDNVAAGGVSLALAELVQTSHAAINPTWTFSGAGEAGARLAIFKPQPAPPVITTTTLPDATLGVAYDQFVAATNSPTFSITTGTLPSDLSLDGPSGEINGIPESSSGIGRFRFTVTATNAGGSDTQDLSILVLPDPDVFPTDVLSGVPYFHYDELPRDFAKYTDPYEYEDGGMDFNRRTSNPPRIFNITFIKNLSKDITDAFDSFWESNGIDGTFSFTAKDGTVYTNVRIQSYSRSHADQYAQIRTVSFVLVKNP
jgi:hypothetical protein